MKNMMAAIFLLMMSIWLLIWSMGDTLNGELARIFAIILFVISGVCFYWGYFKKNNKK